MIDLRDVKSVQLEPRSMLLATKSDVLCEAERINWRSDGEAGEHLWLRRLAMGEVIDFCVGKGIDIGCQANRIVPRSAVYAECYGLEKDHQERFIKPASRWTADGWGDGMHLVGFGDSTLDWAYAGHSLEDQPYLNGTIKMLNEMWRTVRNGGHVVLLLPHKRYYPNVGTKGANQAHQHDWLPEEFAKFVSQRFSKRLALMQLESFYDRFEFDAVFRVVKDRDNGRESVKI